jgi:hypothetical protein
MQRVVIKSLSGVQIAGAEMADPTDWIAECEARGYWGEEGSYTVEVTDISAEVALADCIASRKTEYPSAEEFLNAFFDGGDAALEALKAQRLAIKAKYPKP